MPPDPGLAIHIGADRLTSPRHLRWPVVRSGRDTVERTTRLAAAAGITRQHQLLGTSASRARIGHILREAAAGLDPRGHLLVAFTGHSDREPADLDEPPGIGWCVQLVLPGGQPNPRCTSYRWLNRQLRQDTPDVERPRVWTNRLSAWSQRPFHPVADNTSRDRSQQP